MDSTLYFKQERKRDAEVIKPPNILKQKVGHGGLSPHILKKAQTLLENNTEEFKPMADMYLTSLSSAIDYARQSDLEHDDYEEVIAAILFPLMQLRANGSMFKFHLVTSMAEKVIHFLEVIDIPDNHAIEIVEAFHTSMKAIVAADIRGDGGSYGKDLVDALVDACNRYFDKYAGQDTSRRH